MEQHVGRGQVGDNKIEVNVHTLLDDLRGNEDGTRTRRCSVSPQPVQPLALQFLTPGKRKATVQQTQRHLAFGNLGAQSGKALLRFDDGVANPQNMLAGFGPPN